MQQVSEAEFEQEVLEATVPVVVDFFAVWCGPCKMITPILDELSTAYDGKVKFVKVDIDEAPGIAERFAVSSVPTLVAFKSGEEADRRVGAAPRPALEGWVKTLS